MRQIKAFPRIILIKVCSYFKVLVNCFTSFNNDWRFGFFIIASALISLYVNLTCKPSSNLFLNADNMKIHVQNDVSSSIVAMEPLLKIEQILVQALNEHANRLQEKLIEIRSGIAMMRRPREIYDIDAERFLSRPLHSFPMLRRLKHEWKAWLEFLVEPITDEYIETIRSNIQQINDFDLTPSAMAVQDLCELYEISPNDWVNGKLQLTDYPNMRFNTLDCYAIAFLLYKQRKFKAANSWFEAAIKTFKPRHIYKHMNGFNRAAIYENYALNLLEQNRTSAALEAISQAFNDDPTNQRLLLQMAEIELLINVTETNESENDKWRENKLDKTIKNNCRGEFRETGSSCYFDWSGSDFLRLNPFKVEVISDEPIIMLFHGILNEYEVDDLKSLAKQELENQDLQFSTVDGKLSKSANVWIDDDYNELTMELNHRLDDMTGFNTFGSSMLLGNYGPGAYSVAHSDCLQICENGSDNCDGRLATILIYLSDVKNGGATIFPKLDVAVYPQQGSALFWYNLKNDMIDCDKRTIHMACPVIVGSKWFLIKWIHFKNQMFRKPCVLQD